MLQSYSKPVVLFTVLLLVISSTFLLYAVSTGITQATKKNGDGCICHAPEPFANVSVVISGPTQVQINSVNTYTVTINGGPLVRGGTNIAALNGTLSNTTADLQIIGDELTHVAPKLSSGGTVSFQFNYTAPASQGFDTIYANGNSVNFNGFNDGDQWNFANNFPVQVLTVVPVELMNLSAIVMGSTIQLNWSTGTELNNRGFEIQRQIISTNNNDENWVKIGFVDGNGNSVSKNDYIFEDKNLIPAIYKYRLNQIDFDGSSTLYTVDGDFSVKAPETFTLEQNYPNPFNPVTTINYFLPTPGFVELKIFNTLGIETASVVSEFQNEGNHSLHFDGSALASGVYYYSINVFDQTNNRVSSLVKKMALIK